MGGGWIGESRERRKEIMKILTGKAVAGVDLSRKREGMWREREILKVVLITVGS